MYRDSLVPGSTAHDVLTTLLAYHDPKSDTENYKQGQTKAAYLLSLFVALKGFKVVKRGYLGFYAEDLPAGFLTCKSLPAYDGGLRGQARIRGGGLCGKAHLRSGKLVFICRLELPLILAGTIE